MISINSGQASSAAISNAAISNADTAGAPATSSTTTRASSPPPHHSQCARFMAYKLLNGPSPSDKSRLSSADTAEAKGRSVEDESHLKVALSPHPRMAHPKGLTVVLPLQILQTLRCGPVGTVNGEGPYRRRDADALL